MANGEKSAIYVVKRYRKNAAHHGGAWKVAYADFVTAMMAFFLVMWLITSVSKDQRAAIFDYFKNPSMEPGKSAKPAPGQMGPGGASTSPIKLGGGLDSPRSILPRAPEIMPLATQPTAGQAPSNPRQQPQPAATDTATAEAAEHKKLESLMDDLRKAIDESQALKPFKDQLLLDITPEGLRVQIVDAQNRPMFNLGSSRLEDYTTTILHELATYLNSVPNRISLTGHTDAKPYGGGGDYSNWELSVDRANAARRALVAGGLAPDKVARVVGLSSSVLFDKGQPENPINRRISIVVMTKAAEAASLSIDTPPEQALNTPPPSTR
jgi:chemotaxis protein MotB